MGCHVAKTSNSDDIVDEQTLGNFDTRARYSHRPVEEDFLIDEHAVLGEGCNGCVTKVVNKYTGQPCALKVLNKRNLCPQKLQNLHDEVNNYMKIDHPHIARLLHVYEDERRVCLVMELCAGKELFDRLSSKKQFSEDEARHAAYQMILAVAYLHKHNIVHCDLKLENFLYDNDADRANLKLIDFGFSKVWNHRESMTTQQGTPSYTAPEVFNGNYTDKCDMWSLGVVLFILLGGYPPFPMGSECRGRIIAGRYKFKEDRWRHVSPFGMDFVKRLLVVDPDKRMSVDECLDHQWLAPELRSEDMESEAPIVRMLSNNSQASTTASFPDRLPSKTSGPGVSSEEIIVDLQKYSKCSHLKRAALAMIAHHLSSADLEDIRPAFLAIDVDHKGTITRENLRRALCNRTSQLGREELDRLFDCADLAHDGELHYSEFVAAIMQSRVDLTKDRCREAFEIFDVSRTGHITSKDMVVVFGGNRFEDADVNTLITECDGCSPKSGISFERFYKHLKDENIENIAPPTAQLGYEQNARARCDCGRTSTTGVQPGQALQV